MRIPMDDDNDDDDESLDLNLTLAREEMMKMLRRYHEYHKESGDVVYWDDLELNNHEYDYDYYSPSAAHRALHILELYVLPIFVAFAYLLSILHFMMTVRRNIRRHHHSLLYYLALSVIFMLSLIIISFQIHFMSTYAPILMSNFLCKLLNYVHHITEHAYGYILSAVVIERTLVAAYIYRERFETASTNGITAAKRALGSDWLGRITRGFSSQWATILTIFVIFLCTLMNNVWAWWSYGIHYMGMDNSLEVGWCTSIMPIHSVWQFAFRIVNMIWPTICIIICNIVLFIFRFKRRKILQQRLQNENNGGPKVDEVPPASGRSTEAFNSRVQGSYETEFSGKIQNKNNNGQKTTADTSISLGQMETHDIWPSDGSPPRSDVSWESVGEPRPLNSSSRDFVATWKADNPRVEITAAHTPNSSSTTPNGGHNYGHDLLIDPADDLKQDLLTILAHCISISFVVTRLPNAIMRDPYIQMHNYYLLHYPILTVVDQFLFVLYIIVVPILIFVFHRTVVLRETRVMWGEIQDFWQRVRSRFGRPNLFDRSAQGSSAHTMEGEGIMEDVEPPERPPYWCGVNN